MMADDVADDGSSSARPRTGDRWIMRWAHYTAHALGVRLPRSAVVSAGLMPPRVHCWSDTLRDARAVTPGSVVPVNLNGVIATSGMYRRDVGKSEGKWEPSAAGGSRSAERVDSVL
jgi:hypothetical protein